MKIRNMLNPMETKRAQSFSKPSLTVPDQALTISQILKRFAQGLPLGGAKTPEWMDPADQDNPSDMNFLDPRTMDISEIYDLKRGNEAEIRRLQESVTRDQIAKDKAKNEAVIEAEVQRRLAQRPGA